MLKSLVTVVVKEVGVEVGTEADVGETETETGLAAPRVIEAEALAELLVSEEARSVTLGGFGTLAGAV